MALPSTPALAGNDDEVLVGDDAAMTGGAVTATASDGASLLYNPAGLLAIDDDEIDVSASVYGLRRYRVPDLLVASTGEAGEGAFTEVLVIPSALAYTRPLRSDLRIAAGFFQRRALDLALRTSLSLPQDDRRVTDWTVAIDQVTSLYQGVAGIAWAPRPELRLGFQLSLLYQTVSGAVLFSGGASAPDGTSDEFISEAAIRSGSFWGLSGGAGLQWEPHPKLFLGAGVTAPVVAIGSRQRAVTTVTSVEGGESRFASDETSTSEGVGELGLPARFRAGLAVRGAWGWVAVDGDYQHRLTAEGLGVARRAVWNLRAGAMLRLGSSVRLGLGLFTDRSPDGPAVAFASGNATFYGGSAGVQFGKERFLDPERDDDRRLLFRTTLALRYAHGRGEIGGLVVDGSGPVAILDQPPAAIRAHELSLHLGSSLLF